MDRWTRWTDSSAIIVWESRLSRHSLEKDARARRQARERELDRPGDREAGEKKETLAGPPRLIILLVTRRLTALIRVEFRIDPAGASRG